jgi:hypothetical protein
LGRVLGYVLPNAKAQAIIATKSPDGDIVNTTEMLSHDEIELKDLETEMPAAADERLRKGNSGNGEPQRPAETQEPSKMILKEHLVA